MLFSLRIGMTSEIIANLKRDPHGVLNTSNSNDDILLFFKNIVKELLDPLAKDFSVLDEVYVENLDSKQVFGQARIILDAIGDKLISERIPQLREKLEANEEDHTDGERSQENTSEEEDKEKDVEGEDEIEDESENEEKSEQESESGNESGIDSIDDRDLVEENERTGTESRGDLAVNQKDDYEDEGQSSNEQEEFSDAREGSSTGLDQSKETGKLNYRKDVFGLNDGFFDIDDFNKQILALEDDGNEKSEDIDYFQDVEEDDDNEDMAYFDDFFDQPKSNAKDSDNTQEDHQNPYHEQSKDFIDDDDYNNAMDSVRLDLFANEDRASPKNSESNLSSFEKQQQKLQKEVGELENELIAEKEWTMKGEIQAKERPQDSLLDRGSELDFERTSKPVPIITDQVTSTMEDLIKKRIKDEEFDDVPKRILPDIGSTQKREKAELSDQKSSKSLAEIYEDEYQNYDEGAQKSQELQKQHDEISDLFGKVVYQLDSLTSAHFVPKPKEFKTAEIKVFDAASVNMEDAQPLHISDSSSLAPQEIYRVGDDKSQKDDKGKDSHVTLNSGLSYSKEELSRDEKMRLRRANKRKRSKSLKETNDLKRHKEALSHANYPDKKIKARDAVNTLRNTKNVTVIDKEGKQRDTRGHIKSKNQDLLSSGYKL